MRQALQLGFGLVFRHSVALKGGNKRRIMTNDMRLWRNVYYSCINKKDNDFKKEFSELPKPTKKSILERLDAGEVIVGDGGYCTILEKRCYVKSGPYTPECVVQHPEAVRQLHREFIRGGADVLQSMTYASTGDHLTEGISSAEISDKACAIAHEIAGESNSDTLVAGCVSFTGLYRGPESKETIQKAYQSQVMAFIDNKLDFIIVEYFKHVEEIEWAIDAVKQCGLPVVAMMCIGPNGDQNDVPTGECFVRMANSGADIVGINCKFDPDICLKGMAIGKKALEDAGIKRHLIVQPIALWTPDADDIEGYLTLPETFLALEPRTLTRIEVKKYARAAYEMGIRYIGGCCFFEPYHIRAIAEELHEERGKFPPGSDKSELVGGGRHVAIDGKSLQESDPRVFSQEYWHNLVPATGRVFSPSSSKPVSGNLPQKKKKSD